jgi:COMM domain containing 3
VLAPRVTRAGAHTQNNHVDKVNRPVYLVSLQTDAPAGAAPASGGTGSSQELQFTCTVEQLQDLVDRLKDAAKAVQTMGP